MYPTLAAKASVLLYSVAKAHALGNGNKRMALVSTLVFLGVNGAWWDPPNGQARAHVTWVAASEASLRQRVLDYLTAYFQIHTVTFGSGGRELRIIES